ncbi:MAG: hypothetical protein J0G29_00480 [Alphaproteobacteria bacterium]|nr:hypothetical protein [Alphaproteobacteria bacterium]OJV46287.1 MAG: hypothetical protein BGO28_04800 [Alphaproteobacteria bacterium 43-37]
MIESKIKNELFKRFEKLEKSLSNNNFPNQKSYLSTIKISLAKLLTSKKGDEDFEKILNEAFLSYRCLDGMHFESNNAEYEITKLWQSLRSILGIFIDFRDEYYADKNKFLESLFYRVLSKLRQNHLFDFSGKLLEIRSQIAELPLAPENVGTIKSLLKEINLQGVISGVEGELINFMWTLIHDVLDEVNHYKAI